MLVDRYAPEAIILVGSRADGAARPGSDWDLYVLLVESPARGAGVIPAPAELDGELLDIGLVHLPIADEELFAIFGPNLQQATVLLDNPDGVAATLCARAQQRYATGRGLTERERRGREHEMARNLARMHARSDQPGAFFEAAAWFFHLAHRSWFEHLHDRWSLSVHRALPEIERADPAFHAQLVALAEAPRVEERLRAAQWIFDRLFGAPRAHSST